MRSVLITGGSGFLGQRLAQRLLNDHDRVCVYSRSEHAQADMRERLSDKRLRWFIGDVRDRDRLSRAMDGCDLVIHAAALKRIELAQYCPDELVKTNVIGSMNVIDAAAERAVDRVLLVSTDKACQPVSAYGQTKALAESMFLSANNMHPNTRYSVVRYGNVWGSTGSVVPLWEKQIADGITPRVTDPDCTRYYMTIRQAVDLVADTAEGMEGGEVVIPDLPAYRIGDLLTAMGAEGDIIGLPAWEKKHESMDHTRTSETARRMTITELEEALYGDTDRAGKESGRKAQEPEVTAG